MFGQNPIRKLERDPAGKLRVQEMFYTLQGEGPFAGAPALFIRLAGCHLACTFCDTEFESNYQALYSVSEVCQQAERMMSQAGPVPQRPLVVITGGEPLRQSLYLLIKGLHRLGFKHVQLETAGNLWDKALDPWVGFGYLTIVASPKTPMLHPGIIEHCRHYKYVLSALEIDADGLPSVGTQKNAPHLKPARGPVDNPVWLASVTIWVSPCDAHDSKQNEMNLLAARDSALRHGYRLSLQTHKLVGLP